MQFGTRNFYTEFTILNEIKRNNVAITYPAEDFGALDLIVKIVFYDFNKLLRHFLIGAI